VWRADALAAGLPCPACASGHAALDAQLPGGGWPVAELVELLQPPQACQAWRLLAPALRQAQRRGPLVLVGAPRWPHLAAWAAQGLRPREVLRVDVPDGNAGLWAAEQALRSGAAGAVLLWTAQARPDSLRRLHLAAREAVAEVEGANLAGPLLFAMRPETTAGQSSPAPLRLQVRPDAAGLGLCLRVLKRRGPPLERAIELPAPLPVLACLRLPAAPTLPTEITHVVDRPAAPRRRPVQPA